MKNKLLLTLVTFYCSLNLFSLQINMHTYANPQVLLLQNMIVSPLQIQYRWHYMQKNGKIYKRLYNETNQEWVGNSCCNDAANHCCQIAKHKHHNKCLTNGQRHRQLLITWHSISDTGRIHL